jgi:cob(I)alamin adenosyltransferase
MSGVRLAQGCVQVYTGNGKGKSTAALGLILRAVGAGLKVFYGQFVKDQEYSEISVIKERFSDEVMFKSFGKGCFIDRNPTEQDKLSAEQGLKVCLEAMLSEQFDVIILDEINIAIRYDLLKVKDVCDFIEDRPERVELILTGRSADPAVLKKADLITEMDPVRHYYDHGVLAREGIEC